MLDVRSPVVVVAVVALAVLALHTPVAHASEVCHCQCCSEGVCTLSRNRSITVEHCQQCTSDNCRYQYRQCESPDTYVIARCVSSDWVIDRVIIFSLIGVIVVLLVVALVMDRVPVLHRLFHPLATAGDAQAKKRRRSASLSSLASASPLSSAT